MHERKEFHTKAAAIFERDARKCSTCGGGSFLAIFSNEHIQPEKTVWFLFSEIRNRTYSRIMNRLESKSRSKMFLTVNNGTNDTERRRESMSARRISILPSYDDEGDIDAFISNMLEGQDVDVTKKNDISWQSRLKHMKYLDYRNCRCIDVIDYLYWKLHYHIKNTMDVEKLKKFMLDYSAGLLETGQPIYAMKFLADTNTTVEIAKVKTQLNVDTTSEDNCKGSILILTGDAFFTCGNYVQAKKYYKEAVTLKNGPYFGKKQICYNIVMEKLRHMFQGLPNYLLHRVHGSVATKKLELAICLQRLASVLMVTNEQKIAKVMIVRSFRTAFQTVGGFIEKALVYLTAVEIIRDDCSYIRSLEKLMIHVTEEKTAWNSPEEVVMLAKVWTKYLSGAVDLLKQLYFLSHEDVDKSAITWYYALCLELLLDAGMVLESFETCRGYHSQITSCKWMACVSRDPESLTRLTTCVIIWKLRMKIPVADYCIPTAGDYIKNIRKVKFSQLLNCVKGLECYLLILIQQINIKKSNDVMDRLHSIYLLMRALRKTQSQAKFLKPFVYLLESYVSLIRGRKSASEGYLQKSKKSAKTQENEMIKCWVEQNKRTWKSNYNNMAQYWMEHVAPDFTI
ncbi:Adenylate cyclase type 10 [Dufourea novaeangliae]|uniref:Adenylate cyclase type 10 n=1 Tax=Dufourea novaeangliae TaxID=178035 RepID=A0A154P2J5_DUFNO|nr:Adenylate cyclase type 10 [Dufourea novaeangliae]